MRQWPIRRFTNAMVLRSHKLLAVWRISRQNWRRFMTGGKPSKGAQIDGLGRCPLSKDAP